ncbi:LuxR family transcriptional regulator [Reticulibacter mediterranei]|uniref:LuxR family transcriptional regulator n=1 Tax=Reticulibacter mediterranei TaxID=2778369 RepID=A0A8J3MYB3_9CHLR|nr:LuxR C-terminal-related transcriptional regulator [Reticulibacter mediterranei]GHO90727.1 LuxR family transcriptional regulator [Reticulibacter mediterranei]
MISILATKLYLPRLRPNMVSRLRLIGRLNEGLHRKLTLVSAPAGFGKTTLISSWIEGIGQSSAWLSLDEGENDPTRFLTYLVAALQTIAPRLGEEVLRALQSPQPPSTEAMLMALLNDLTITKDPFVLVLDDYHMIEAKAVDQALTYLINHLPPHMHLVITTREDPQLPLARLRAQDQLTELRAADLRFTLSEAATFLNQVMSLTLSDQDIAALERRTEGWVAGLQFAALALQGCQDPTSFISSFTGSHHFVLDYLMEEVLGQQDARVQTFLLRTSILNRLSSSLCDAVVLDPSLSGQATLEYLERANLFIVSLDSERCWYRYHHLFADLLRLRLQQSITSSPGDAQDRERQVHELHIRASAWYENHDLAIEAFHHAVAANDVERAERLIEGKGIPRHFRGAVTTLLNWLGSLPTAVLDAKPSLRVRYASLMVVNGQTTGAEEQLQAAEATLQGNEVNDTVRDLIGQIAAIRATLALTRYQIEPMLAQSRRALEYLHPNNLFSRVTPYWVLGYAYSSLGDRAAARQAFTEGLSLGRASGHTFNTILVAIGLGHIQEADNQLSLAAETYRRVLQLASDQPLQIICEAHLGLARVLYEWNELDEALQHGQQSLRLAKQYDRRVIDRYVSSEIFLARLKLAQGDVAAAAALLEDAHQSARRYNFVPRFLEVAAAQVLVLLHQGDVAAAARIAQAYEQPISQARVHLAQGNPLAALAVLEAWRRQAEAKDWKDERLKAMVMQSVALKAHGEKDEAVQQLCDALVLAEPGGFIRLFVDEGLPMAHLLSEAEALGRTPNYIKKLLAVLKADEQRSEDPLSLASQSSAQLLIEPLSQREVEVLHLIAQGLSNQQISERLFLALDTVKGHNRKIFGKLQVQRRTEAVARARQLGLV